MATVKRAVIMAAGKGERMRPLTLTTPKPLIRVNGIRMIDSVISALHRNGIFEIYVVIGYQKELFARLEADYSGLKLIENPDYDRCNNIASLYYAREHLSDCIILDGDQIIRNPAVLTPEFERSGYNAVWTDEETDEWLLTVENEVITCCSRTGGKDGWQLYSISCWTAEDGAKLCRHLELEYEERKNTSVYWDDVPLFCHPEDYKLGIREMSRYDVVEIDTLEQLAAEDPGYLTMLERADCHGSRHAVSQ